MRINLLESLSDNIVVDKDKCTACGVCVRTCILDNLRLKLAPCRQACPLGVNCQGYVQLIARGREPEAMEMLREDLPFPGILGRICSQPCEARCYRREVDGQPVAIRALKRYLVEAAGNPVPTPVMPPDTGKKVAVVGAGPAGLAAAYYIRLQGHAVTIFDGESEPGGMLRWAVPEFRLPLPTLEADLELLWRLGVVFQGRTRVGDGPAWDEIQTNYDAVVTALGCPRPARLNVPGEDLPRVLHGLAFLKDVRSGRAPALHGRVIVIGGGNVAVDSAQTALRLGAESAIMVSLESERELPAASSALDEARAEGVDMECSWGPVAFVPGDKGQIHVSLRRCLSVLDAGGLFCPEFDDARGQTLAADWIVVAVGQSREPGGLPGGWKDGGDSIAFDPLTLQGANPKIFHAGDFVAGPSSAVEAMASGKRAAESVNRFLAGRHLRFNREYAGPYETDFEIDVSKADPTPRQPLPSRPMAGPGDFNEIERAFDRDSARREALRCLSCGAPFGKYRTCWFCLPCEVECPQQALWVEIPYLLR